METSPLSYRANQWTGFYMIGTAVMKDLNQFIRVVPPISNEE